MSEALNITTAAFGGLREVTTAPLWQYDYGQILKITGLDLPQAFEVHFSNSRKSGETITQIGTDSQVTIPDMYLTSGADIYAFVFLHDGTDDGETEYVVKIPVRERPEPSDIEPTPEQQDAITEAIAALNVAVEQCEAYVEHYPTVINGEWYVWNEASEQFVTTGVAATGNGIAEARLNSDYTLTLTFTDGTFFTTPISIRGAQGEKGDTGAVPNFSIGTVTTLPAGSSASASITGTQEQPVLNLSIPQGQDGAITNLDTTLTVSGKAADAKATGDAVNDLKEDLSYYATEINYVESIVAPAMHKITLENGTISNPNNAIAVRGEDTIPCKYGDTVTVYPVRPNETGYYYSYGYRIYDANGNTVLNFPDVSPSANTVIISQPTAASIKFFWIETNGTNNNALRYDTYGYVPYAVVKSGTSIIERAENLYLTYGGLSEKYTITHNDTASGTLTYGDAHFMAVLPCAPNIKYHVKLSKAVTTHPRLWIAWADKYPERGGTVYNISEEDNASLDAYYTTGDTARFLVVYLGFTLASGDPTSKISITGDTYYQDPYARQYINDTHDLYRQSASVLKLKKTGDETYGECDAKFMFMTDIHGDVSRLKDATRRYKEWGNSYISAVLNGGDTVYQKLPDGLDWYYDQIETLDMPVLPTVGNHDAWSALSVLETDPVVVYDAIIAPIVSGSGIVQPANAATNGYNYYYKDFNGTVRLIVVDCMYWNATQLSWLENVLADAKTNSLHVLIMTHSSFPWADMETVDCSWSKAGMLGGYSSQAVLSDPSRTNIQAAQAVKNFVDAGGMFICWLTGHQHGDDVHILPNHGNQFVITLGSFAQRASMLQKSDVVTDYNYNCLTYITIDTFLKTIKFMRVGADIDMYGVKHNMLSLKYDENKIISSD